MTFSAESPGTDADAWVDHPRAGGVAPLLLDSAGTDHVVVLAAHPDDETLGAGGLLSKAARSGIRVTVVVATYGEASHPGSTTHTAERLAALRRAYQPVLPIAARRGHRLRLYIVNDRPMTQQVTMIASRDPAGERRVNQRWSVTLPATAGDNLTAV